jgi:hypothetical protein
MLLFCSRVHNFENLGWQFLQFEWTGEPGIGSNPNFLSSLRSGLARNIGRYFPDLHDEVVCALDDVLGLQGIGEIWCSVLRPG